jgi:sarcosine oxidase, subunit alpha
MIITLDFEGRPLPANDGEPLAVALYRAGERVLGRSAKYHRPRGAYCMTGHCGGCLVRVDGIPSRLACEVPCRDEMKIARQNAYPNASTDLLRAADFVFPKSFNHHQMLAGVPGIQPLMTQVARKLAGLGELPATPGEPFPPAEERRCGRLVVGLGPAGRAMLPTLGPTDLAIDALPFVGNDRVWPSARALGVYFESGRPVVAVRRSDTLVRVLPERVALCTGSRMQIPPFEGCDLPGVMTADAARILARHGVVIGMRALSLATADLRRLVRVQGGRSVERAVLTRPDGTLETLDADAVIVDGPRAPAFELGDQAGAEIVYVAGQGYAVGADAKGQTRVPWLSAFGACATTVED